MRINYDFHIHSALSPCADNENTPLNIVGMASAKEVKAIAITDHNAISNVEVGMLAGQAFGVCVIPGVEIQTNEEIHVLALFKTFQKLKNFYDKISFPDFNNDKKIFGDQLIFDEDNEIVGEEKRLLLVSANIGIYELIPLILESGGRAIPAHIDREANGILAILGELPLDLPYSAIEFSPYASQELKIKYKQYKQIVSSDAHHLEDIHKAEGFFNITECNIERIFDKVF